MNNTFDRQRLFRHLDLRAFGRPIAIVILAILMVSGTASAEDGDGLERATFAGGCFWCMEPPYDEIDGVVETISGFSGGHVAGPSYDQVVAGGTGHLEVVQILYDPEVVGYQHLLDIYWRNIDPVQSDGQFCDRGPMYRTAIFTHDDQQHRKANASRDALASSGRFDQPIRTEIRRFEAFYPAEPHHQGYYRKNPVRYRYYRWRCGRDQRLEEIWGDEAGGPQP